MPTNKQTEDEGAVLILRRAWRFLLLLFCALPGAWLVCQALPHHQDPALPQDQGIALRLAPQSMYSNFPKLYVLITNRSRQPLNIPVSAQPYPRDDISFVVSEQGKAAFTLSRKKPPPDAQYKTLTLQPSDTVMESVDLLDGTWTKLPYKATSQRQVTHHLRISAGLNVVPDARHKWWSGTAQSPNLMADYVESKETDAQPFGGLGYAPDCTTNEEKQLAESIKANQSAQNSIGNSGSHKELNRPSSPFVNLPPLAHNLKIELVASSINDAAHIEQEKEPAVVCGVLTNCGKAPIKLWSGGSWAYFNMKLEVVDDTGHAYLEEFPPVGFMANVPGTVRLLPGQCCVNNFNGSVSDNHFRKARAVYKVDDDPDAKNYEVWTGAIATPYRNWDESLFKLHCATVPPELQKWWQLHGQGTSLGMPMTGVVPDQMFSHSNTYTYLDIAYAKYAQTLLLQAQQEAEKAKAHPLAQAATLNNLGNLAIYLGDYEKGLSFYTHALHLAQSDRGPNGAVFVRDTRANATVANKLVASSSNSASKRSTYKLVWMRSESGAEEQTDFAVGTAEGDSSEIRQPGPGTAMWGASFEKCYQPAISAALDTSSGHKVDLSNSIRDLRKLVDDARKIQNPQAIAVTLNTLGNCYFLDHQYESANQAYTEAIAALDSAERARKTIGKSGDQLDYVMKSMIIQNRINVLRCHMINATLIEELSKKYKAIEESTAGRNAKPDEPPWGLWWIIGGAGQVISMDLQMLGSQAPKVSLEEAIALFNAGTYQEALDRFDNIESEYRKRGLIINDFPDAYYYKALTLEKLGRHRVGLAVDDEPMEMLERLIKYSADSPVAASALATRNEWIENKFGKEQTSISFTTFDNPADKPPPGGGIYGVHFEDEPKEPPLVFDIKINGKPSTALFRTDGADSFPQGEPAAWCDKNYADRVGIAITSKPIESNDQSYKIPDSKEENHVIHKKWRTLADITVGGVTRRHVNLEIIEQSYYGGYLLIPNNLMLSNSFFSQGHYHVDNKNHKLLFTGKLAN